MIESNILHCDLNNFFASVECVKNNELKLVPMAVCGDPKLRHGVILAKNDLAKKYGIITGETVYTARKKCPELVLVENNHEDYNNYSKLVRDIYLRYTNKVEVLSIDECYLDITESINLFGDSVHIANLIKEEVKEKTSLTISVGVSFNKSFAKIGSDMKKPDAITVIDYSNFKRILYPKPIEIIMSVGKATKPILNRYGIYLVGDLAHFNKDKLVKILGKKANDIYNVVHGLDNSKVKEFSLDEVPKSVSKGTTFKEDTNDILLLEKYISDLSEIVAKNLRGYKLKCRCVGLSYKDSNFVTITRQKHIEVTNSFSDISKTAKKILKENLDKNINIRSITISANNLVNESDVEKSNLFESIENKENDFRLKQLNNVNLKKKDKINVAIDNINKKYGKNVITYASVSKIINKSANSDKK